MKHLFLMAIIASVLVSCKQDKDKTPLSSQTPGVGPIKIPAERKFSTSEMVIGRRICAALKNKRELFESIDNQTESFRLKNEYKECTMTQALNLSEFTATVSNATTSNFEYVSTTTRSYPYLRDVITDQTGAMKVVCENLAVSDTVSNNILIGSSYAAINFLISDGYDRFEITKLTKNSSGVYEAVSADAVNLITQANQASSKFYGVEKERTVHLPCSNPNQTSYNKQTWIAAVTDF